MVMGCVVSVYLDKRGPVVGLWVAPVTLVLGTGTVQPVQTQAVSLMLQCTHRPDVHCSYAGTRCKRPGLISITVLHNRLLSQFSPTE